MDITNFIKGKKNKYPITLDDEVSKILVQIAMVHYCCDL